MNEKILYDEKGRWYYKDNTWEKRNDRWFKVANFITSHDNYDIAKDKNIRKNGFKIV